MFVQVTAAASASAADAGSAEFYNESVLPILEARCFECHGPDSKLKGGLFLGNRDGILTGGESGAPITIGFGDESVQPRDLLITLCDDIPAFVQDFPRVAELVTSEEDCRMKSRQRYATYRDQGHKLETHKI